MISFRVSEEEFLTLRQICAGEGFVSFSDLIRTAVQELVSNRASRGPTAIHDAVQKLSMRIDALDQHLREIGPNPVAR
jgi:hypothetical protein